MPPVPDDYPHGLSDDGLAQAIEEMVAGSLVRFGLDFEKLLPELQLALIQAGLQEQSRREFVAMTTSANTTLLVAKASLAAAVITLAVAVIAVFGT